MWNINKQKIVLLILQICMLAQNLGPTSEDCKAPISTRNKQVWFQEIVRDQSAELQSVELPSLPDQPKSSINPERPLYWDRSLSGRHPHYCQGICNNPNCKFVNSCGYCHQKHAYGDLHRHIERKCIFFRAVPDYTKFRDSPPGRHFPYRIELDQLFGIIPDEHYVSILPSYRLPTKNHIEQAIRDIEDVGLINQILKSLWIDLEILTGLWGRTYSEWRRYYRLNTLKPVPYRFALNQTDEYCVLDLGIHHRLTTAHIWFILRNMWEVAPKVELDTLWEHLFGNLREVFSLQRIPQELQVELAKHSHKPNLAFLLSFRSSGIVINPMEFNPS